jgi:hypothetical protein
MAIELLGLSGIKLLSILIIIANIVLAGGLLYLYVKSYNQIKIGFTVGLILFASLLMIKNMATIVFILTDSSVIIDKPYYVGDIIELIALTILLKVTWDY